MRWTHKGHCLLEDFGRSRVGIPTHEPHVGRYGPPVLQCEDSTYIPDPCECDTGMMELWLLHSP